MSIRTRLSKLETAAGVGQKFLEDMSDAEIESFIGEHLGLPKGTPISDDMLLQVALDGKVQLSRLTHEETLDHLK